MFLFRPHLRRCLPWIVFLALVGWQAEAQEEPAPVQDGQEQPTEDPRQPVPGTDDLRKAGARVKAVFENDFKEAEGFDARRALAKELLKVAAETAVPAEQYVLLRVGREIAAGAGDAETALLAVAEMSRLFRVDELEMKEAVLAKATTQNIPDEHRDTLIQTLMQVAEEAVAAEKYDLADTLLDRALTKARRAKQNETVRYLTGRQRELTAGRRIFEAAEKARADIKKDPNNAAAQLVLGKYLCFVKQNYQQGLPHLAQGSDAALKLTAELELAPPQTAQQQVEVADAWWSLAESQPKPYGDQYQRRAGDYYQQAVAGDLAGLAKIKAERRLQQLAEAAAAKTEEPGRPPTPRKTLKLAVLYKRGDHSSRDNHIRPNLKIVNNDSAPVPLSELTVRYYLTGGQKPKRIYCDWAQVGKENIRGTFQPMKRPTDTADMYLQLDFAEGAGEIEPGRDSGAIHLRIHNFDWSRFTEDNDHSFDGEARDYVEAERITLYHKGNLVWGKEPGRR